MESNFDKLPTWLQKLWELDAPLAREAEKDLLKQKECKCSDESLFPEAVELIRYFVNRVEDGSIRSNTTYKKYKDFLDKLESDKISNVKN